MSYISDINGGSMQVLTNSLAAIAQGDLVELAQDGKAYTVKVSDCAAVANAGQVVAPTQVYNGGLFGAYSTNYSILGASIVATDGYLYQLEPNNGSGNSSYGLNLVKYSLSGTLIGTLVLDTSTGGSGGVCRGQIVQLTGGNLAIAWSESATTYCFRAVVSLSLQIVFPATVGGVQQTSAYAPQILPISTGGFVISSLNQIGFYTAAGAIVGSLITYDSTGTASNYAPVLGNLSNGNILVAYTYAGTPSIRACTYNTSGVQQIAPTTLWTANVSTVAPPLLSILPGYFALAQTDAAGGFNVAVYVFNNAFTQQGSAYHYYESSSLWYNTALTNDGTQFWSCCSGNSSPYYFVNTAITTAGVSLTYNVTNSTGVGTNYFNSCWAAGDPTTGIVTCVYGTSGTAQPYIAAFNGLNGGMFFTGPTVFDSTSPTNGPCQANIVPAGDFTFAVSYNYYPSSTAEVRKFYVWKAYSSSIQGVAVAAAAVGTNASVQPQRIGGGGSAYATNKIGGTTGKAFNHNSGSSPNIVGNKGSMTPYGVSLLGIS